MGSRTTLPIPEDRFGNFIGIATARFPSKGESNVQIHDLVDRIRDGVRRTITDVAVDLALMLCNDIKELGYDFLNSDCYTKFYNNAKKFSTI